MTVRSDQTSLSIRGWDVGFQKVKFTTLLQRELGLGLEDSKRATDRVLNGERVEVVVGNVDLMRIHEMFIALGAIVGVEKPERTCP